MKHRERLQKKKKIEFPFKRNKEEKKSNYWIKLFLYEFSTIYREYTYYVFIYNSF